MAQFMRNVFLFTSTLFLLLISCDNDVEIAELHLDGANQSAPFLASGSHEAAVRFTSNETSQYSGRFLELVEFYLLELPNQCEVLVYDQGTNSEPGTLLYSASLSGDLQSRSWNTHRLANPVEISGTDLWICVRVTHNAEVPSIGCDPGPAKENGDWMRSSDDNLWRPFRSRTNQAVDINWNIRGWLNN